MRERLIVNVTLVGREYIAKDSKGKDWTSDISETIRKRAFDAKNLIEKNHDTGKWNRITADKVVMLKFAKKAEALLPLAEALKKVAMDPKQVETMKLIHDSYKLKPDLLEMDELRWKFLMRSAMRGKNILMTGPSGCGKTMAAKALVNATGRPDFYFNLGATQDPRATLIGNTHYEKDKGTFFAESVFVKAIQTEKAVILLDELSRAHPEAWNILMTVLDESQRYLRLDEKDGSPTIKVADGVCFIATANIGAEFTATRVMDRALLDRFTIIEVTPLDAKKELGLLKKLYPSVAETRLKAIAEITEMTRKELKTETPRIDTMVSTRMSVEMGSLLYDGFSLHEAAEVAILPFYSAEGGTDSPRTFMNQLIQKFVDDGSDEDLFNLDDVDGGDSDSAF
jgi:nitric oxide reductase NorQ protein